MKIKLSLSEHEVFFSSSSFSREALPSGLFRCRYGIGGGRKAPGGRAFLSGQCCSRGKKWKNSHKKRRDSFACHKTLKHHVSGEGVFLFFSPRSKSHITVTSYRKGRRKTELHLPPSCKRRRPTRSGKKYFLFLPAFQAIKSAAMALAHFSPYAAKGVVSDGASFRQRGGGTHVALAGSEGNNSSARIFPTHGEKEGGADLVGGNVKMEHRRRRRHRWLWGEEKLQVLESRKRSNTVAPPAPFS